jgi:mannose-6-phosphate isomerase
MFVEITNSPRDYAWGSTTLLPEFLGVAPDGKPQAELWLGTHAGSPARVVGRDGDLRDVAGELPFLLKVLAAGAPLSLQTHPTTTQAQAGFAREDAAGIPIDAPHRNYKDPHAKPEMIYALSDEFRALSAFRPVAETRAVLDAIDSGLLRDLRTDGDLKPVVERLLTTDVAAEVADVTAAARHAEGDSWATVRLLAEHYPGDPGVAVSLLLHTVVLRRGEALYLPAGNIHAYLSGLGVELMGPSDNVLRCGLTPKHVDVPELLSVVDFTPVLDPRLAAASVGGGVTVFAPDGAGWELRVLDAGARLEVTTPAIAFVLEGSLRGLSRGSAAYLVGETIEVAAAGRVVVATAVG